MDASQYLDCGPTAGTTTPAAEADATYRARQGSRPHLARSAAQRSGERENAPSMSATVLPAASVAASASKA
jgi:hypothetical protein